MTPAGPPPADFRLAAADALHGAALEAGLSAKNAQLLRLFGTAVYHLPEAEAVARITAYQSPESFTRLNTAIQVTRWLVDKDYPAVEPLAIPQPITSHGCVVTFWRYLPQDGPPPEPSDLGRLLRRFHQLSALPTPLPAYRPLTSIGRAIEASRAISDEDRDWLTRHRQQVLDAYQQLDFQLPAGPIHGDAWRGNLLRDGTGVVLADWDTVSTGPRETDLIPTLQASRFGLPREQCEAFIEAYGRDIRGWNGYPVLVAIRELSTLSALLRYGHASLGARSELAVRIRSLRVGDDRLWTAF